MCLTNATINNPIYLLLWNRRKHCKRQTRVHCRVNPSDHVFNKYILINAPLPNSSPHAFYKKQKIEIHHKTLLKILKLYTMNHPKICKQ